LPVERQEEVPRAVDGEADLGRRRVAGRALAEAVGLEVVDRRQGRELREGEVRYRAAAVAVVLEELVDAGTEPRLARARGARELAGQRVGPRRHADRGGSGEGAIVAVGGEVWVGVREAEAQVPPVVAH